MIIEQNTHKIESLGYFIAPVVVIFVLVLTTGCTGTYGSLKRDADVQQAFESNQVPQEYKYYFYGFDTRPYVIIGIDPKFKMNSKMWREVIPGTAEFKEMTRWTWEDYGYYKFGADILDPQGAMVGVFYSALNGTSFKFTEDNQIMVMPNTPFLLGPETSGGNFRRR